MISSRTFLSPFLIFEVVSDADESHQLRMLLEAIAVAKQGQYLTRQGQLFVVADDLRENSIAKRYIVANSGSKINMFRSSSRFLFLTEMSGFQCYRLLNCTNATATRRILDVISTRLVVLGLSNFQLWISRVSLSVTSIFVELSREP